MLPHFGKNIRVFTQIDPILRNVNFLHIFIRDTILLSLFSAA